MTREQMWKKASEIEKMLEKNNVYASVYPHNEFPVIQVEISWGDWKHDHARTDWLIADKCGEWLSKIGESVTEEDGSDTYSSTHNYIVLP